MMFEKHVSQKCKEFFNGKKTAGKDAYFRLLGCTTLFAAKNKLAHETVQIMRTEEMEDKYAKRSKLGSWEIKDTL